MVTLEGIVTVVLLLLFMLLMYTVFKKQSIPETIDEIKSIFEKEE